MIGANINYTRNSVCPTCVGMNRSEADKRMAFIHRLPHVRGDEPAKRTRTTWARWVCPTCVGMNRR